MSALTATIRGSFTEARSNARAFTVSVIIMAVNDLAWLAFWLVFFRQVGTLRGWDSDSILIFLAVISTAAGLVLGFVSNSRRVGTIIHSGELDSVLALPVSPLPHLLLRRVEAVNLGDLVFGVGLFAIAGSPTPQRVLLFVFASLAASVVFAGFLVVMGSLTFFAGKGEAGELGFHSIVMFAAYPVDVFTGFGKALLYTAVPAGFVAAAPASLVDDFDVSDAALLGMAAIVFAALAATTFTLGLRRYTGMSGRWTTG